MSIGLLLCDHLDPEVAEAVGDYTELYPEAFGRVGVELRIYEATRGELPSSLDECEGWITSGSRASSYEDEQWIHDLAELQRALAEARRPQVGICFGHQLLARALGGHVELASVGWGVGGRTFEISAPAPWMDPAPERFTILMSHRDQVTRLPEGAQLVAGAEYCPVGAYRIEDHVFCVQGHPEFVPELSRILMERRREAIGEHVVAAGLSSLEGPLDQDLVIDWIARFFDR